MGKVVKITFKNETEILSAFESYLIEQDLEGKIIKFEYKPIDHKRCSLLKKRSKLNLSLVSVESSEIESIKFLGEFSDEGISNELREAAKIINAGENELQEPESRLYHGVYSQSWVYASTYPYNVTITTHQSSI